MGASHEDRLAAYRDPAWRASAWEELSGGRGMLPINWGALSVAESGHPELVGRKVMELAAERGGTVAAIHKAAGQAVDTGDLLVEIV
jgi:hypothetical protein